MKYTGTMDWTFEPEDGPITAIDFSFSWGYNPQTPDVMYLRNGDPGYPGDPEEMEITEIERADIKAVWFGDTSIQRHMCQEQWFFTQTVKWLNENTKVGKPLYNAILERVREELAARLEVWDED